MKNTIRPDNTRSEDYGPDPFVVNLTRVTRQNPFFRRALWTGRHLQMTLMSIPVGGEIGLEQHPETDQFLYIVEGRAAFRTGFRRDRLTEQSAVGPGDGIFIPAGAWHNLLNEGRVPVQLFSVYAPPHHPRGVLHKTKREADETEMNTTDWDSGR